MKNTIKLPSYIKFAIEYEKKCIEIRKKQIESYEKKIAYFKAGMKPSEVTKKIPQIHCINFDYKKYNKLKKEWVNATNSNTSHKNR